MKRGSLKLKEELKQICDLYAENREALKKAFPGESMSIFPVCAAQLTGHGKKADAQTLKASRRTLRSEVGVFSNLRGIVETPVVTAIAIAEDPKGKTEEIVAMYRKLKEYFFPSEYLAVAASVLTEMAPGTQAEPYIERGRELYRLMKSEHPLLTSQEDSVMSVLLAFSEKSDGALLQDMESIYRALKAEIRFGSHNNIQTVSHILAMSDAEPSTLVKRFLKLFNGLKEKGCPYGRDFQLPALAVLALSGRSADEVIAEMIETEAYLKPLKGYHGIFGFTRKDRFMHAAMLLSLQEEKNAGPDAGILTSTIVMIAAQQAAMCAMVASMAASSASSSAH